MVKYAKVPNRAARLVKAENRQINTYKRNKSSAAQRNASSPLSLILPISFTELYAFNLMKNVNINFISGSLVDNLFIIRHESVGDGLKAPFFHSSSPSLSCASQSHTKTHVEWIMNGT